jgi:hypothetical protein
MRDAFGVGFPPADQKYSDVIDAPKARSFFGFWRLGSSLDLGFWIFSGSWILAFGSFFPPHSTLEKFPSAAKLPAWQ